MTTHPTSYYFRNQKIVTSFVYPPIPVRSFDWAAHFDDDEPDDDGRMMVGRGATEQAAVQDLKDQAEE